MTARAVNLALYGAVPALVMTGLLAWAFPAATVTLLTLHRAIAATLVLVLAWKEGIARRSIARRARDGRTASLLVGAVTSTALLLCLGIGLAWTAGLVSFDRPVPYSLLNVHVIAGVALIPLVVAHAASRWPGAGGRPGRRSLLRMLALGAAGVVLGAASDRFDPSRRSTGSRAANGAGGYDLPATIWTFDSVPEIDAGAWRLRIDGLVDEHRLVSLDDLARSAQTEREDLIDCTGGWWSVQRWRGVALASLVTPRAGSVRVRVTSVTGHRATFDLSELDGLLVATHVGGVALTREHGAPARLVARGHRGFEWVKWLDRIEVI